MNKQGIKIPELRELFYEDASNPADYKKFEKCAKVGELLSQRLIHFFYLRDRKALKQQIERHNGLSFGEANSWNSKKIDYYDRATNQKLADFEAAYVWMNPKDGAYWTVEIRIYRNQEKSLQIEYSCGENLRIYHQQPEIPENLTELILDVFSQNLKIKT